MEKERKILKEMSILILIFAGLSLVRMVVDIILNGFDSTQTIEGMSQKVANAIVIAAWICGLLFLFLEFYVGCKGLKTARNPDESKRHITFAKIIFV